MKQDPLLDGSVPDIVIDDKGTSMMILRGEWNTIKGGYGTSVLVGNAKFKDATVRYLPKIKKAGRYAVYTYMLKPENLSKELTLVIYAGHKTHQTCIKTDEVEVRGQTSDVWVFVGDYEFGTNDNAYIGIFNKTNEGILLADAVLLKHK